MIKSLHLRNFKCFKQQDFNFAPLTLLSGLNGMGKSSVLQSLVLLRQSYQQGTLPDIGVTLNADLLHLGTAQDILYQESLEDELEIGIRWLPLKQSERKATFLLAYDPAADVLELKGKEVHGPVFQSSLFSDDFRYLQAERVGPRVAYSVSDFMVRRKRQIGTAGEYAAHYLAVFGDDKIPVHELAHPATDSLALRHQLEAWLGEISPGVRLNITPHPDMDMVNLRYSFAQGTVPTRPFRSTGVGFGITYTLPVLLAILSARRDSLLLLENPEAHLHPSGQAQIGTLMAKATAAGLQIIAETHSDHVINGVRLAVHNGVIPAENVANHFFTRLAGMEEACATVVSPRMYPDGRMDQWPDGFFDQWDKSLEALLGPKET